ncbi:Putative AAA+ ATPase domain, ATPase, AAA-type, core [Septoria linicola]|uniref:AAA+ ATPase domain, ATPase, AAA-type, core n=1 Tax=Septoria linicola TaxID=215465 RepID=A0A9Q9APP6_9PEZI|nr:putative AAA+ ATPase domain, ATPase, AAA-type, core [Septoria linicola]USW49791.1 Putative AAA+ ATPase domain, ATPase, AAA-type, core [Septoria linicola]
MEAKVNGIKDNVKDEPSTHFIKELFGVPNERGGLNRLDECPDYLKPTASKPDHALVTRYQGKRSDGPRANFELFLSLISVQSSFLKHLAHREGSEHHGQLSALVDGLERESEETIADGQSLASNGNITFGLLWTLYPPGSPVFAQLNGKTHCFLVDSYKYLMAEHPPTLAIQLFSLNYDGTRYGWQKVPSFIAAFPGSTKILALPVIPFHFCEGCLDVLESLYARGVVAVDLTSQAPAYRSYDGSVRLNKSGDYDFEDVEVFVDERLMIEPMVHSQQASQYCPRVFTTPHKLEFLLSRDPHTKAAREADNNREETGLLSILPLLNMHPVLGLGPNKLTPMQCWEDVNDPLLGGHRWTEALLGLHPEVFCRSVVRGYLLGSKCWAEFEVDNIAPISWNEHAFDSLVSPPPRKRLLEALVRQQKDYKAEFDDVVQGKGQGLIMLLSGPPATGKTLTAESISDHLKLPLYAISAGELGDTAKDIEHQFLSVLRLAASWDAILLLDEADAFLEKRSTQDTPGARDRNKRVAAFLRILEYYRGILVLRTNRAVNFDDAFYSRIHLSLPFNPLDQHFREDIWKNFLKDTNVPQSDIPEFAREELNGRQIKNVVKMARLLAKDNGGLLLQSSQIRDVLSVTTEDKELI